MAKAAADQNKRKGGENGKMVEKGSSEGRERFQDNQNEEATGGSDVASGKEPAKLSPGTEKKKKKKKEIAVGDAKNDRQMTKRNSTKRHVVFADNGQCRSQKARHKKVTKKEHRKAAAWRRVAFFAFAHFIWSYGGTPAVWKARVCVQVRASAGAGSCTEAGKV